VADGIRTRDHRDHNPGLYQLSYRHRARDEWYRAAGFPPAGRRKPCGAMRGISLGAVYVIVGVVVAALNDYFDKLGTLRAVGEAILAVIIWPLILVGVDVNLR
jgi:hypothetical protein